MSHSIRAWAQLTQVRLAVTLVLLTALPAAPALAKGAGSQIAKLEKLLESGSYVEVIQQAQKVRGKLIGDIRAAETNLEPAAHTLVMQAIAEANMGRDADALWNWHLAQTYIDGLPNMDLSGFGRAAEILGGRSVKDLPAGVVRSEANEDERYRPVRIRRNVRPVYPKSLGKSGFEGAVRIELIVGTDGQPHQPVVASAGLVPTMAFPALEALRTWQFEPATLDKEAVPVRYELEIKYW